MRLCLAARGSHRDKQVRQVPLEKKMRVWQRAQMQIKRSVNRLARSRVARGERKRSKEQRRLLERRKRLRPRQKSLSGFRIIISRWEAVTPANCIS